MFEHGFQNVVIPHVRAKAQAFVGFHGVRAAILQMVGADFVEQADTATLLTQIEDHASAFQDRKSTRLNSSHVATAMIYTLSLHDALPILSAGILSANVRAWVSECCNPACPRQSPGVRWLPRCPRRNLADGRRGFC